MGLFYHFIVQRVQTCTPVKPPAEFVIWELSEQLSVFFDGHYPPRLFLNSLPTVAAAWLLTVIRSSSSPHPPPPPFHLFFCIIFSRFGVKVVPPTVEGPVGALPIDSRLPVIFRMSFKGVTKEELVLAARLGRRAVRPRWFSERPMASRPQPPPPRGGVETASWVPGGGSSPAAGWGTVVAFLVVINDLGHLPLLPHCLVRPDPGQRARGYCRGLRNLALPRTRHVFYGWGGGGCSPP